MTTREVLASMIASEKALQAAFERVGVSSSKEPFDMFNSALDSFYGYIISHIKSSGRICNVYSKECFRDIFYCAVISDREIPQDICEWADGYYKGFKSAEIDLDFLSELETSICKRCMAEAIRDHIVRGYDEETAEIRALLDRACIPEAADYVSPLYNWARAHDSINYRFILNIFKYGYIQGKRTERARRSNR